MSTYVLLHTLIITLTHCRHRPINSAARVTSVPDYSSLGQTLDRGNRCFSQAAQSDGVPHGSAGTICLSVFGLPPAGRDSNARPLGTRTNLESAVHLRLGNEESLFQASLSETLQSRGYDAP